MATDPERLVYLDYNASTPLAPSVKSLMAELLEAPFGNPSSSHWAGAPAKTVLDKAREQVAALLNCDSDEVVFTSGGSESNNTVLKGVWRKHGGGGHIVTSAIEHPAILEPCKWIEANGGSVTRVGVDSSGTVNPGEVRVAIKAETALVTIMHANNETGAIQPIEEIGAICRERGVPFHTDAAQSAGKIKIDVREMDAHYLSLAGHKFYAPKGIGALYVRRGAPYEPLIHGAGHERGMRAGTESVILAGALGEAARLVSDLSGMERVAALRERFLNGMRRIWGDALRVNGALSKTLPNTLHVSYPGIRGGRLLEELGGVAASTGAACHSGVDKISHVLEAMGADLEAGVGAVRWSLGRDTSEEEIDHVLARMGEVAASRP